MIFFRLRTSRNAWLTAGETAQVPPSDRSVIPPSIRADQQATSDFLDSVLRRYSLSQLESHPSEIFTPDEKNVPPDQVNSTHLDSER